MDEEKKKYHIVVSSYTMSKFRALQKELQQQNQLNAKPTYDSLVSYLLSLHSKINKEKEVEPNGEDNV